VAALIQSIVLLRSYHSYI